MAKERLYMASDTKRVEIINSDVYCAKCGEFLGMTCDPFRDAYHKKCFGLAPLTDI